MSVRVAVGASCFTVTLIPVFAAIALGATQSGPRLTGLSFAPNLNTTSGPADLKVTISAADDVGLEGASFAIVNPSYPTRTLSYGGSVQFNGETTATRTASITFTTGSETGT